MQKICLMISLSAIKYLLSAAIMVLSFFIAFHCLFAHEVRREAWRSVIKRRVYFSQKRFKTVTILIGWVCLLLGLCVAYLEILHLMES